MRSKLFSIKKEELGISYFSGTGAGGQHRNRHMNCVRMFHRESGAKVSCQDFREKSKNQIFALRRLAKDKKFINYIRTRASKEQFDIAKLNEKVDRMLHPKNLRIETYNPEKGKYETKITQNRV